MNRKITPEDLPDFGAVPEGFVPTDLKIEVPKPVTKDSPIEELETPDQLEQGVQHGKDWSDDDPVGLVDPEDNQVNVKVNEKEVDENIDIEYPDDLRAKHPEYEMNIPFQIKMFHDMIHSAQVENRAVKQRMDNLEIKLDLYPDECGPEEIVEMRQLMFRNIELQGEIQHYSQHIAIRNKRIQQLQEQANAQQKPRSFWKRVFNK